MWRLHLIFFLTLMSVLLMFRWTNKQPGIQKFWNSCGLYQDIYDWISPLNKRSGWSFILTQQSMGRNEYGISGHLHIFAFLKHLMVLLRCNFSGLHFYTLSKTLIACRDMQFRFFKVKTLLNNAFKVWYCIFHMLYKTPRGCFVKLIIGNKLIDIYKLLKLLFLIILAVRWLFEK